MSESLTQEQFRNGNVAAMPVTLGEVYNALSSELTWVHLKWFDFLRLYATSQEQVDLLNAAAPAFFHHLQQMMWEDVLLHLCRLTDPPKSMGHDNLTILRIPGAIPDIALRQVVQPLVDDAKQKSDFARDWRNRRLAHLELPVLNPRAAVPLATASRQNVEEALAALRNPMNHIERHYLGSYVSYEYPIEAPGGVDSLLLRVKRGLEAEKAQRESSLRRD
jgi:hypothetical protein